MNLFIFVLLEKTMYLIKDLKVKRHLIKSFSQTHFCKTHFLIIYFTYTSNVVHKILNKIKIYYKINKILLFIIKL